MSCCVRCLFTSRMNPTHPEDQRLLKQKVEVSSFASRLQWENILTMLMCVSGVWIFKLQIWRTGTLESKEFSVESASEAEACRSHQCLCGALGRLRLCNNTNPVICVLPYYTRDCTCSVATCMRKTDVQLPPAGHQHAVQAELFPGLVWELLTTGGTGSSRISNK